MSKVAPTSSSSAVPSTIRTHHIDFKVTDEREIDLESADGVLFAVSRSDLRRASTSLAGMFAAPVTDTPARLSTGNGIDRHCVTMWGDTSSQLVPVLKLMRGEQPSDADLPTVQSTRDAMSMAGKHNMDNVLKLLETVLHQQLFRGAKTSDPLLAYAVACQFNWTGERTAIMRECLTIRLDKEAIARANMRMDDLLHLLALRRDRVHHFRERLHTSLPPIGSPFGWANRGVCPRMGCPVLIPDKALLLWAKFQHLITWRFADVPDLAAALTDTGVSTLKSSMRNYRCTRCGETWWIDIDDKLRDCVPKLPVE